jgi:hypothetical protein
MNAARPSAPPQSRDLEFEVLGTLVRTRVEDPELADRLAQLLDHVLVEVSDRPAVTFELGVAGDSSWTMGRGEGAVLRTDSQRRLLERYFTVLNELWLDDYAGLTVHAGVVAEGAGAIAFPGATGTGKSTIVAACVTAGWAYVSDEALCIDTRSAEVVAYPRPLLLSDDSLRLLGVDSPAGSEGPPGDKVPVSPRDLRGSASEGPLRLEHVVLPVRGPSLRLEPLSSSEVVPVLLENSFSRHRDPAAAFDLVATAASGCRAWRLFYGDAREAADLLRRRLS